MGRLHVNAHRLNGSLEIPVYLVVRQRTAFSVLELLIALGLLGTLLALAWSILGSYRSAQQRGWDQSYRLQLSAAARELLEEDALHWSPMVMVVPGSISSQDCSFTGTESGFSITTMLSLDPLPWLEQVLSGDSTADRVLDAADLYGQADAVAEQNESMTKRYPLPQANTARLSYSLKPDNTDLESPPLQTEFAEPRTLRLRLERSIQVLNSPNSRDDNSKRSTSDANRLLTTADLYRQTDSETQGGGSTAVTHNLRGLEGAVFRYFDGKEWQTRWESTWQQGLPRAIELSFDFPAVGQSAANLPPRSPIGTSAGPNNDAPAHDVRIIVLVPGSTASTGSALPNRDAVLGGGRE